MAKYISILTDYGTQALAKALANNQPLRLMQFAVGDGNGQAVTPNANRTALVNEKHRANVSAVSIDPRNNKQIIVELTIPENVGGFFVREMGVFDEQNKLIAYANTPESYKPTLESGSGKIQVLRMVLMVSSSNAVTLSVDNSVIFVTRGQLTPHTITATSANSFDQNGHSHAIDKASTTNAGIVQLTDDTGLDSDKLGLTARAGKKLAQWIANLQLALNNYIPLNKRSSAVNSDSNENVATSAAVKTAYDKAVNAENLANTKWTAKSATETEPGILPISHKTDGTDKNKFASEFAVGEVAKGKADAKHTHKANEITDFDENTNNLIKQSFAGNLALTGWSRLPNGLIQQWSEVAIKDIINDTNRDMSTGSGNLFKWVFPISFPKFCGALTLIELGHPNHQDWNAHIQRVRIHTLTNSYALIKLTEWQQANQDGLKIKLSAIGV